MALSSFGVVLIVIAGGVITGCLVWIIHLNIYARRHGVPSPSLIAYFRPPSSNPVYIAARARGAPRSKNTSSSGGGGGFLGIFKKKKSRGEFGPLGDDSGAWDARGYNGGAYYEEDAEMGLRVDTSNDGRSGRGQGRQDWDAEDDSPPRGRSRSRSPRPGYDVNKNRGPQSGTTSKQNPFGDEQGVRRSTDTGRSSVFTEEQF